jgi:hypothetical protein
MRLLVAVAVLCVFAGCSTNAIPGSGARVVLKALYPNSTPQGIGFNIQTDGNAALAVACENATKETVIVFDGQSLPTVFGSPTLLSTEVPSQYYSKTGVIAVSLISPKGASNSLPFEVK